MSDIDVMNDIKIKKDTAGRVFDMSIDINATPEAVWSALTEAQELTRWFPLQARVVPGKGGSMFWGWDAAWAWKSSIAVWEPHRRLKLVETRPAFDVTGQPLTASGEARELAVEVTLESHAGKTRLRLVHSGFGQGANWDDELGGISTGWQFELRGLRHYLEHHRGRERRHGWARASTNLSNADVWRRLLGPDAFDLPTPLPNEGEPYTLSFGTHLLTGETIMRIPEAEFAGNVSELHGGVFRLGTFRASGRTGIITWITSYDEKDAMRLKAFETDAQAFIDRTFGRGD